MKNAVMWPIFCFKKAQLMTFGKGAINSDKSGCASHWKLTIPASINSVKLAVHVKTNMEHTQPMINKTLTTHLPFRINFRRERKIVYEITKKRRTDLGSVRLIIVGFYLIQAPSLPSL